MCLLWLPQKRMDLHWNTGRHLVTMSPYLFFNRAQLGDSLLDIDSEVKLPNDSAAPKDAIQDMHDRESFPSD